MVVVGRPVVVGPLVVVVVGPLVVVVVIAMVLQPEFEQDTPCMNCDSRDCGRGE